MRPENVDGVDEPPVQQLPQDAPDLPGETTVVQETPIQGIESVDWMLVLQDLDWVDVKLHIRDHPTEFMTWAYGEVLEFEYPGLAALVNFIRLNEVNAIMENLKAAKGYLKQDFIRSIIIQERGSNALEAAEEVLATFTGPTAAVWLEVAKKAAEMLQSRLDEQYADADEPEPNMVTLKPNPSKGNQDKGEDVGDALSADDVLKFGTDASPDTLSQEAFGEELEET
jgi:hypothetical protein